MNKIREIICSSICAEYVKDKLCHRNNNCNPSQMLEAKFTALIKSIVPTEAEIKDNTTIDCENEIKAIIRLQNRKIQEMIE